MPDSTKKEQTAKQIWLLYFNKTLFEKGIITEKEHNLMKIKIQSTFGKL